MKFVTYNLCFGGKRELNPWKKMMDAFSPDFVFAQETFHPSTYFSTVEFAEIRGCIHENVPTHQQWGSAILSKRHRLEKVKLTDDTYSGWVVAALAHDVEIGGEVQSVLLVSFHAPSLESGSYEKHVEEILTQIASGWKGTPMLVGGDFNLTTAYSKAESTLGGNTVGEERILSMLNSELGLFNTWQHQHPNEELPQTLRWSKDKSIPYHCDAIFLGTKHLPHLITADIPCEGEWGTMSDHNPVLVSIR